MGTSTRLKMRRKLEFAGGTIDKTIDHIALVAIAYESANPDMVKTIGLLANNLEEIRHVIAHIRESL